MTIEKTNYKGWNSYRVSSGEVELVVTADIGPRIMRYGFVGSQNLFKEFAESLGKSGEPKWVARGGHRLGRRPRIPSGPMFRIIDPLWSRSPAIRWWPHGR